MNATIEEAPTAAANAKPAKTPKPAAELISPEARERCAYVAQALDTLCDALNEFVSSGHSYPPQNLYTAVERVLVATASLPEVPWPSGCYDYIEAVITLTKRIMRLQWRNCQFEADVLDAIRRCTQQVENVANPKAARGPKTVYLETPEMLREQGVTNPQIALIYDWRDEEGNPDVQRVLRCFAGDEEAPKAVTLAGSVKRMSSLQLVDAWLADLQDSIDIARQQIGDGFEDDED
jgi:hypothetical protein